MKKNKIKNFILGITFFTMGFFINACTTTSVHAEQTHPLKIYKENESNSRVVETWKIVDDKTEVNYIVVYTHEGVAITPRLNSDGSLYVSK